PSIITKESLKLLASRNYLSKQIELNPPIL
ncbi:MAG: hypothetical protein ACI8YC_000239, partial [Salibacteraceae bacterium]